MRERAIRRVAGMLCVVGLMLSDHRVVLAQTVGDPTTTGIVLGQVVMDGTFRAVPNAFVSLNESDVAVRSDSTGAFLMRDVAPGSYMLTVRAVGYDVFRHQITVRAGQEEDLELVVTPLANRLDSVTTVAEVPRRLDVNRAGFEERREMGLGRFLEEKDIDRQQGGGLASLLRSKVPGLNVVRYGANSVIASSRGATSINALPGGDEFDRAQGAPDRCYVQIIVNNIVYYGGGKREPLYNLDKIDPTHVIAIEYYTVSQTPAQFNRSGSSSCGTLLIWLRN